MNDIHVLFVDDEPDILSAIKRLMGRENYAVRFAGSGVEALSIMAAMPIHIIISDMKMPEMDGSTLLRHVKEIYPDTVRMALSANLQFDQLLHCINTGEIYRYITKPTKPEELKQALRDAMNYYLVRKDRIALVLELQEKNEKLRQVLEQEKKVEWQLRKNQIELEAQNEKLRVTQDKLETTKSRYFDLYDLAPIGYCTICEKGLILEANLTAATLLGMARNALIKQPISRFIVDADQDIYSCHCKQLIENGELPICELRMAKMDGTVFWAHLVATIAQDADVPVSRLVMSDINDRKLAEKALQEANRKLESLSNIDGLTGIFNRRYFNEKLAIEYKRLSRSNGELSLIMMDIDHFKDYNDYYGHVSGDDCLKHVAQMIQTGIFRSADLCARYGGEEFVCVLPETDKRGAGVVAEKIRHRVESLCIEHKTSQTSNYVTISLGVATIRYSSNETAIDCINKADKALYQSKKSGRNRVTHFSTE
jgi:diguanylate cyclase (GGDEF)-like protein/PAS domain S-box-containing protein